MKHHHSIDIQKGLLPCLLLSAITGLLTGILIFLFKSAAAFVISLSETAYSFVRGHLLFLPLLLLGAAIIALIATVGHGMIRKRGTASRLFRALAVADVNVRMIDQGSSELNIIVGVDGEEFEKAVSAIYYEFA